MKRKKSWSSGFSCKAEALPLSLVGRRTEAVKCQGVHKPSDVKTRLAYKCAIHLFCKGSKVGGSSCPIRFLAGKRITWLIRRYFPLRYPHQETSTKRNKRAFQSTKWKETEFLPIQLNFLVNPFASFIHSFIHSFIRSFMLSWALNKKTFENLLH